MFKQDAHEVDGLGGCRPFQDGIDLLDLKALGDSRTYKRGYEHHWIPVHLRFP